MGGTELGAAARRWHRTHAVLGMAVVLTLLGTVIAFVELGTRPQITLPLTGAPDDDVIALAFGSDGATLTAVTTDGTGQFRGTWQWRLSDGAIIIHPTITHPTATDPWDWFTDVVVNPYGTSVRAVFDDPDHNGTLVGVLVQDTGGSTVDLCNLGRCGFLDSCAPYNYVTDVSISADGRSLATGSECGLQLWEIATGVMTASPITIAHGRIDSLTVNPAGTRVAAGVGRGMVRVWDAATHEAKALSGSLCYDCDRKLVFSGNGAVLAAATDEIEMFSDDTVQVWSVVDGALLSTIPIRSINTELAITPGGETVATYNWDGTMRLWDVETGRHIATLPSLVTAAAFSPDGTILATGTQGAVQLWNVSELVAAQS